MNIYTVNELREMYLSFFESKGHLRLPSFSLIPEHDKSLLLINSGMAPMKAYFTGQEKPPRTRVTTCQKCIRTGDIDNIGHTARHGTFFEMLGNFSFGDYFKKEAIEFSWEFLTVVLGLDKDRLYPSVYENDDEAFELWHNFIGVPAERIFKFGKADNFWEHGAGPCGPCSEIYYDRGEKYGCKKSTCTVGCDCDRYMEIWNNVFTQFENDGNGNYTELKQKNIDTGMGLERLAVAVQDVESIFEIDTSKDLMNTISILSSHIYKTDPTIDISLRILADHIKSCTFMIADGILPSNEGRGYVLRRLLRRAVRHGKMIGINKMFMQELATMVIKLNASHYTELKEKEEMIFKVLNSEEKKFLETLDQGENLLNEYMESVKQNKNNLLSGDMAFKLYDTFGFPLDLTKEIALENNILVDENKFYELMQNQKEVARNSRKTTNYMGQDATCFDFLKTNDDTIFTGYDKIIDDSKIIAMSVDDTVVDNINEGDRAVIITEKTPFYATMGGQVGDKGIIKNDFGEFKVYDTIKILNTKVAHIGEMINGTFKTGDEVTLTVDEDNRFKTSVNHTATHLLHAALREILGKHVEQAGSLVDNEKLRFDFTHFSPMTNEEVSKVEILVNKKIDEHINVNKREMKLEEAKKERAMALFGEKYKNDVRTVKIADFSFELCGGTHIDNTEDIKYFKIIQEESVGEGVRRITAITSSAVINFYKEKDNKLKNIEELIKTNELNVVDKVNQLVKELKIVKQENEKLKIDLSKNELASINVINNKGLNLIVELLKEQTIDELKSVSDLIKEKYKDSIVILASKGDKPNVVVSLSNEAVKKGYNAGNIIKDLLPIIDGKGGGKDKMAQGSGKNSANVNMLLDKAKQLLN